MARNKLWTSHEDSILYYTVRDYLKRGLSKDAAFEVVSEKLKRTIRGCSDRWNKIKSFHELDEKSLTRSFIPSNELRIGTLDSDIINNFMDSFHAIRDHVDQLEATNQILTEENRYLRERLQDLEKMETTYQVLRDTFAYLGIDVPEKLRLKQEKNGNLERVTS